MRSPVELSLISRRHFVALTAAGAVATPFAMRGLAHASAPMTAQYFNIAAFAMPTPLSATVGDFGNAPLGLLRNPTVSEWDVTLERRIPFGRRGVRLLLQTYNLFNQVEWTTLNAALTYNGTNNVQSSTTAGQYGTVINPRQIGLSVRFDF